MFKRKIITWKVNENFNITSIHTDLNSILHQKLLYFKNSFILKNDKWNIVLDQYIESNKEVWINYMTWFYNKLFSNDISYSKKVEQQKINYDKYEKIDISLKNSFYFSMKKPATEEISSSNYTYSSKIVQEIIDEYKNHILDSEELIIEFQYWYTEYSKLFKNILFWIKMIFQNNEENNEMFSSYTDKLQYVKFRFNIYTNSKNPDKLKDIIKKNLCIYGNKFNNYVINKKHIFKHLYSKLMIDNLTAQSIIIPIYNSVSANNKTKIIPYNRNVVENWMIKIKEKNNWIIYWRINKNNTVENKTELYINKDDSKSSWVIITGQTGAGKSFSYLPILLGEIIKSDKETKNEKFICIDPNTSMIWNINNILWKYTKYNQSSKLKSTNYKKVKDDKLFINKKLVFNPLLVKNLYLNSGNSNKFNDLLNFNSELILESIKGVYNESAFWANNEMIIKSIIELLILLNSEIYSKININNKNDSKTRVLFSIWDISNILNWFLKEKTLIEEYSNIFNKIIVKEWVLWDKCEKILIDIEYYIEQSKKNISLLNSSINKLKIFENSLKYTFWYGDISNISIDLKDLLLQDNAYTEFIWIDLWDFSFLEKEIITSFFITYSYFYWLQRNQFNPHLPKINITIDEFWSIVSWENLIKNLASTLAQCRKYKLSYVFLYQDLLLQKWVKEIYENMWHIICFSISTKQADFLLSDFNSWTNIELETKDLVNQNRWSFKILVKTKNENITLSCHGLNIHNRKDLNLILNQ